MTRSDLIRALVAANPHLSRQDVTRAIDVITSTIIDTLAEGRRVELRRFGTFLPSDHSARLARNLHSGTNFVIPPRRIARFRMGETLLKRLNAKRAR